MDYCVRYVFQNIWNYFLNIPIIPISYIPVNNIYISLFHAMRLCSMYCILSIVPFFALYSMVCVACIAFDLLHYMQVNCQCYGFYTIIFCAFTLYSEGVLS